MKNKSVFLLLAVILISSCILIYKIKQTKNYNPEMYMQVYKEYYAIANLDNNINPDEELTEDEAIPEKTPIVVNKTASGNMYRTIGILNIEKINISYPIINECTEDNLNIAPTKLLGPTPNTPGNLVVVGHNNWNKEFFSNLHKLENDDIVEIIDTSGKKMQYKVYDKYQIKQDDFSCLEQNASGQTQLTLITCVKHQKAKRLVVKCVAI